MGSEFLKKRFSNLISQINEHDIYMLASSLAFNLVLAVAPFLILLLIGAALLPAFYKSLVVAESQNMLGPDAGTFMGLIVRGAENNQYYSGISGYISLVVILISASSIFSQLQYGMDKINGTESSTKPWSLLVFLKERVAFLFFLFGMVVLMLTSLVVSTFVNSFMEGTQALVYLTFSFVITVALQTLVFACIFHFIPTERFTWARSFVSGFIAALFFAIGKELVSLYLGRSAVASIYGAAGSAIIFLLWLYYCSLTFYISHEFTNNFFFRKKTR